jgi:hypothetical protein
MHIPNSQPDQIAPLSHEIVQLEAKNRQHKLVGLGLAAAIGVSALAGCGTSEVNAEKDHLPTTSVVTETPTSSPESNVSTLEAARAVLDSFKPAPRPSNYEFADNKDTKRAAKDAEAYLANKQHSKLAIVDYTAMSPAATEQFGEKVAEKIKSVTVGTFKVDVDVYSASDIAQKLYAEHNKSGVFNPRDSLSYGAVIADAVMSDIKGYQSVIALTDSRFDPSSGMTGDAVTLSSGRYADLVQFTELEKPVLQDDGDGLAADGTPLYDPSDIAVHEWLHAIPALEHSKTIMNENGDLGGAFPSDPNQPQHANLQKFIQSAHLDEFGGADVLGQTSRLGELPELSTAQLYLTEAAERMLDKPHRIHETDLNKDGYARYTTETNTDTIAIYNLENPLHINSDSNQGINQVTRLAFSPQYHDGMWSVRFDGLTVDNGTINLMTLNLFNQSGAIHEQTIDLPNGHSITASMNAAGSLEIKTF